MAIPNIQNAAAPAAVVLIDPATGAPTTGGAGSGGDASAANQTLQITQETAINTVLGAIADAASATGSVSAKLRFIAVTGIPITGTVTVGSHAVTNAGTFVVQENGTQVQVDDAAFTPATGKVVVGGYLNDDTSTDVVDEGDGGAARITKDRKQIFQPYESALNKWNYAAPAAGLVSTTEVTAKAAVSGLINYITSIQVTNSHATIGSEVQILDGTGGTVLHRGWAQPTSGYVATFPVPLGGTANTLVSIKEATATATTGILMNIQGYVGV